MALAQPFQASYKVLARLLVVWRRDDPGKSTVETELYVCLVMYK